MTPTAAVMTNDDDDHDGDDDYSDDGARSHRVGENNEINQSGLERRERLKNRSREEENLGKQNSGETSGKDVRKKTGEKTSGEKSGKEVRKKGNKK